MFIHLCKETESNTNLQTSTVCVSCKSPPWHTFGSGQLSLGWFREAHSPKIAFSRKAAALFQGFRKFKPIDKEPDHGT